MHRSRWNRIAIKVLFVGWRSGGVRPGSIGLLIGCLHSGTLQMWIKSIKMCLSLSARDDKIFAASLNRFCLQNSKREIKTFRRFDTVEFSCRRRRRRRHTRIKTTMPRRGGTHKIVHNTAIFTVELIEWCRALCSARVSLFLDKVLRLDAGARFSRNRQGARQVVGERSGALHTHTNCIQCEFTFGLLLFFCILFSDSSVNRIERKSFSAFSSSMCATRRAANEHTEHTLLLTSISISERNVAAET